MKRRPKINKLCSKERVGRLVIGLFILLLATILAFWQPVAGSISIFFALYLIITGLVGGCLLYAIWKE